jgi:hypothetical protein
MLSFALSRSVEPKLGSMPAWRAEWRQGSGERIAWSGTLNDFVSCYFVILSAIFARRTYAFLPASAKYIGSSLRSE